MARRREFDPGQALQAAIEMFWEKGYHDSSVDELVQRSGVAKYGLYGTFGPKRELFKKALEQYARDRHEDIQAPLRRPGASLPQVPVFFRRAVEMMLDGTCPPGCLMCNTGVEFGSQDSEMEDLVRDFFIDLTQVVRSCLERAVAEGELSEERDLDSLAAYLVNEYRTLLMLARAGHSKEELQSHLRIALRVLPQPIDSETTWQSALM